MEEGDKTKHRQKTTLLVPIKNDFALGGLGYLVHLGARLAVVANHLQKGGFRGGLLYRCN
mgnify:CR=1 FL=1